MNQKTTIYILTYNKEIDQDYDRTLYVPLICGDAKIKNSRNYLRDNTGDNISHLNKYYSELSGEYWAWKNADCDIIGFCHYRRWYVKNIKWEKISALDILNDLKKYDIILPHKLKFTKTLYEAQKESDIKDPDYDISYEDYLKVGEILHKYYPDYAEEYNKVMNGKIMWSNNMFICKRELADDYFEWLFDVLNKLMDELDLTKYHSRDTRVFGFIGERLLTTYIIKNNFKIKEYDVYASERKIPILQVLCSRSSLLFELEGIMRRLLER